MPCVSLTQKKLHRPSSTRQRRQTKSATKDTAKSTTKIAKPARKSSSIKSPSVNFLQESSITNSLQATTTVDLSSKVRLKDGDYIQIRPHRPRPTTRPTSVTTPTSARSLKSRLKNLKSKRTKSTPKVKPHKSPVKPKSLRSASKSKLAKPNPLPIRYRPSREQLINAESRLGSTLFGPIPDGHRREFFHDRDNIWIWHESWTDSEHHARQLTVRYEARPSGVYKKVAAGKYFKLEGDELENFRKATRAYLRLIKRQLYHVA